MAKEAIAAENVAMGHQATFAAQNGMSAVPPISTGEADMRDVRNVPNSRHGTIRNQTWVRR
jgi:hypothetical protein